MKKRDNEINNNLFNTEREINDRTPNIDENYLKPSKIVHYNKKYNLSDWWNNIYKYRIGFMLENIESFVRYQPVDVSLTFRENEHYESTSRLVRYNATGNNEWSEPIPIQVWDIETYQSPSYIKSCKITFLANISAKSNNTYFLYFNDNNEGISDIQYNTDFSSTLSNGELDVSVGPSGSKYRVILEEGKGVSKFIRNNINFHSENSLTPERQLTHPSLSLLAHCDEGAEIKVDDSSGNNLQGYFIGDTSWTGGIVNNGLEFDGDGDYITFNDVLNNPFGSASKEFTITTWIKPKNLTKNLSNYNISNCFMAKASEPYNDNFELGVYRINETHGLLNLYIDTAGFQNQSIFGDKSNPIRTNQWNFIAVRYNEGNVDVQINDLWYTKDVNNSEPWDGAKYLDQASGSYFTLGATIDSWTYFNGTMDEIAIYNIALTNTEIQKAKFGYSNSSIILINELEELEIGDVFSKYQITWDTIYDMHIEDIITFYYDYNLWNIHRTIYFDDHLDQNNALMIAMNTYYNLSDISDHQNCKYIYDGIVKKDITATDFIVENYTIIHCTPDPLKNTIGLFIESYNLSNILQSSINYLKGNINYSNDIVKFTPGSITDFNNSNGGEDFKLFVSFWEYIDSVNQTGNLDNVGISQYFNNTYQSLKKPINIYIFKKNSLKFNLEVYVEDIDEKPVNNAIVSIYNLTNEGKVDSCIATKETGPNGKATFQKLLNGTYTINITYTNYNQPAFPIIPKPVNITIDDTLADINDNIYYNFYNVSLTTLKLTLQRVDPKTLNIKESVVNANVSFWINDGSGDKYVGYELTDESGKVEFYWLNFTHTEDGNVTFSVTWYDTLQKISTEEDLDGINYNKNITLPFYKENTKIVNVSSYEFSCALVEYVPGILEFRTKITFRVNYTYTINYTNPTAINGAKVHGYIEQGGTNISSVLLEFNEPGLNGTYELKINTSNPQDPEIEFQAEIIYKIHIYAFKGGYIPKTTEILFQLTPTTTQLTLDKENVEVYWKDILTLNAYYEDILAEPYAPINGATVHYSIVELPYINGNLFPNGTIGWYKLNLNSTEFANNGTYTLNITAYKKSYVPKSITIPLIINQRSTNFTLDEDNLEVYWKDILTLNAYYEDISSEPYTPINGATVNYSIVELPSINGTLPPDDTYGWYKLNLNITEFAHNGNYTLYITACKKYYESKSIAISITPTNLTLDKENVEVYWEEYITLNAYYEDISEEPYTPINGATVNYSIVELPSINGTLLPNGTYGWYKLNFSSTEFVDNGTYTLNITAYKKYYIPKSITIPITITIYVINTTINNSNSIDLELELKVKTRFIGYFNYTIATTGEGIQDCDIKKCEWSKFDLEGYLVDSGITTLDNIFEGIYELDFNTEFLEIATYILEISISKTNYIERSANLILKIVPRELNVTLPNIFDNNNEINIISGETLAYDIILNDSIDKSAVIGANAYLRFESKNYGFIDNNNGYYSLSIVSFKTIKTDLMYQLYSAEIIITEPNYTTKNVQISINVRNKIIEYSLSATNLKGHQINIVVGKDVKMKIQLRDPNMDYAPIKKAVVFLRIETTNYGFEEKLEGIYEYTFSTEEYDAFIKSYKLIGEIHIKKANFLEEEIGIIIIIEPDEIYPGISTFYYINLTAVASFLITILIGYLLIRKKNQVKSLQKIKK
ncbi:MAG: LamG-like jellyroll fold domain-containing protein [Candidatus Hodarchaeota archaeon]